MKSHSLSKILVLSICVFSLQGQSLDSLAKRLSELVFSYDPAAQTIVDSMYATGAGQDHKVYQHTLGNHYYFKGLIDSAYVAYLRALKLAEADGDSVRILSLNNNIGVSLMELGQVSGAIDYLTETLDRRKRLADTNRILSGYRNLIEAYQILGIQERVAELLHESYQWKVDSLEYTQPLRNLHLVASFYHYKREEYDSALYHLSSVARLDKIIQDERQIGEYYMNIGRVYLKIDREAEALEALGKAEELFIKSDFKGGLQAIYSSQAEYFQSKEKLEKAIQIFQKAIRTSHAPDWRLSIYQNLSALYRKRGNYQKALEIQDSIIILSDSLTGLEVQKAVFDIESRYKLKEKENEIERLDNAATIAKLEAEQLETKAQRLNIWLWSGGLAALVLILFLIGLNRNIRLQKEQAALKANFAEQQAKLDKQSLQVQLFRTQINPHFFFNTLYAIQSYVLTNDALESSRYLGKLASLMRSVLELNDQEFIRISEELNLLENYLSLEKLRFEEKFEYQIDCPPELMDYDIPTMILQPFVENALVHGFSEISAGGLIKLSIREVQEDEIEIVLSDNGKGYKAGNKLKTNKPKNRSMALNLIEQRLKLLSAEGKGTFSFRIQDRQELNGETGTQVIFNINRSNSQ